MAGRANRETTSLTIIADGAIAQSDIGEGRLIPVVLLDSSQDTTLSELVRLHKHLGPGDVHCSWAVPRFGYSLVVLTLRFERPQRATFEIPFKLPEVAILVEQIVKTEALYLQPGQPGDRLKSTLGNPRILCEIQRNDFAEKWDDIFLGSLTAALKRKKFNKREARRLAKEQIQHMRELAELRLS
jgi:hypothetical protein